MEMSIQQLRELLSIETQSSKPEQSRHSFQVGEQYLIRTVTHYYTGRLIYITDTDFLLADAAWIPDTGRFSDALKKFSVNECEPFNGNAIVSRGAFVDATIWKGKLPTEQK